jgi:hypothetical protein
MSANRDMDLTGRKVLVKLIDRTKFVDVLVSETHLSVRLAEHGRIRRIFVKKIAPFIEEGFSWATPGNSGEFDPLCAKDFPNICPMRNWVLDLGQALPHGHWVACMQPLDATGCCEKHGKVRYTLAEAARDAKERLAKEKPSLRKEPPRRVNGKRTTARMMHVRKVNGW